jgi:hypothetical protein
MALSPRKEYPDYYRLMKAYGKLNLMIKYPEIRRIFDSGNRELAAIDVLLAILGSLGKVANLIASLRLDTRARNSTFKKGGFAEQSLRVRIP